MRDLLKAINDFPEAAFGFSVIVLLILLLTYMLIESIVKLIRKK